jgi:hypothetical protein
MFLFHFCFVFVTFLPGDVNQGFWNFANSHSHWPPTPQKISHSLTLNLAIFGWMPSISFQIEHPFFSILGNITDIVIYFRSEIKKIFTLSSPFSKIQLYPFWFWNSHISGDYSADNEERFECLQLGCDLLQVCDCARCSCCSECNRSCTCEFAASEPDAVMEKILGVGDAKYRYFGF